jgi:hypothetical protein
MRDVLKTNNAVLLNFAQVLLADAGIEAVVFDGHMSVMDGSLGILPRRLMVADDDFSRAERLLKDGLPDETPPRERIDGRQISRTARDGRASAGARVPLRARRGDACGRCSGARATTCWNWVPAQAPRACVSPRALRIVPSPASRSIPHCGNRQRECARKCGSCACVCRRRRACAAGALRRGFAHVFSQSAFSRRRRRNLAGCRRANSLRDDGHLADWFAAGLKRVASGGTFTTIVRADRLADALTALPERGVAIFPLWPRAGEPAKRVILQATKGFARAFGTAAGSRAARKPTAATREAADAILREGCSLALAKPRL